MDIRAQCNLQFGNGAKGLDGSIHVARIAKTV
jgi:hypothetical protein